MIILFFVTIYLFSVVPAFSSWQTERKAEIRSEEEKFETIFSETTADFRNKPGKGHWRVCKGCVGTDLKTKFLDKFVRGQNVNFL